TPHGYVETQTQIFSIISFSLAAAGVLALLTMCGLPALVTGPAGIVLGIVGHNKRESLGVAAAVTHALNMIPLALVLIFVAGAFWSVGGSALRGVSGRARPHRPPGREAKPRGRLPAGAGVRGDTGPGRTRRRPVTRSIRPVRDRDGRRVVLDSEVLPTRPGERP